MLRVLAWVIKFTKIIRGKLNKISQIEMLLVEDLEEAEIVILKLYQKLKFKDACKILNEVKTSEGQKLGNRLGCLNPFMDENGLTRISGRLRKSSLEFGAVYPVLLSKTGNVTKMVVRWYLERTARSRRNITLNELRSSGYWVMQGNSVVRGIISKCVTCRRLRGKVGKQFMADLPSDRLQEEPPFSYCGVDMLGPFHIKEHQNTLKCYGVLFTCLASQAVHIEMTKSMETDSFKLALRHFIARRGNVRTIRCNNRSNFVGAEIESAKSMEEMNQTKIQRFMLNQNTDWITWKRNPLLARNMGGVCE